MDFVPHTPAERVVERVSEAAGIDPLTLPPLYDAIEPDALDALIGSMVQGSISFEYAGHQVAVDSHGTITVDHNDSTTERSGSNQSSVSSG